MLSGLFYRGLIYRFLLLFLNIRLLFFTTSQFIIGNIVTKIYKKIPRIFLGSSIILMFVVLFNILDLTRKVLYKGHSHDVSIKFVMLYIITLILVYSLVYYSIYNYDKQSFTYYHNVLDKEEDVYFNILYFSTGTNFMSGTSDIVPRTRFARTIVITHFIATVSILLIVLHKL
jgi:hypothetical protein